MSRPGRARLSSGKVRTVSGDASPRLGISDQVIVLGPARDELSASRLQSFARFALAVLVGAGLYVVLAATVAAVMGSGAKNALAVRAAFPGGIAGPGGFRLRVGQALRPVLAGQDRAGVHGCSTRGIDPTNHRS